MPLIMTKYVGFENREDVEEQFEETLGPDITLLIAAYNSEQYEGDAFVLFTQGGKLYEVNASHCSCYGLEDQWKPEETTLEAVLARLNTENYGCLALKEVRDALNALKEN